MTVLTKDFKEKPCKVCSTPFKTRNSTQKYCSLVCAKAARKVQTTAKTMAAQSRNVEKFKAKYGDTRGKVQLKCATCKIKYDRYASQIKFRGSNYCSMECKALAKTKAKTRTQLVKALDAVYSQYIRLKYAVEGRTTCVTCGVEDEWKNLQNGHYVSRGRYSTRWVDDNCHPQCYRCNVGLGGNYAFYSQFMIKTYGVDVLDRLIELSNKEYKATKFELQESIEHYSKLVEEFKEGKHEKHISSSRTESMSDTQRLSNSL